MNKNKGRLFIISAPSGSGKSTLVKMLLEKHPGFKFSVSYTTRQPRPGEENGRDYNFVSKEEFKSMIDKQEFLEWAEVFGNYYGTGRNWVETQLEQGHDIIADLDVKGAAQVKASKISSTFIFLAPPNMNELCCRLAARKTETKDQLNLRLKGAEKEILQRNIFDYLVVNDKLDKALSDLEDIIMEGHGQRMSDTTDFWQNFFNSCDVLDKK